VTWSLFDSLFMWFDMGPARVWLYSQADKYENNCLCHKGYHTRSPSQIVALSLVWISKRFLILIINWATHKRLKTLEWNLHNIKDLTY